MKSNENSNALSENSRRPLVILTGPTGVGKTDLSIALAKAVGGEIISADSMQVYRGMDIGTAKIRPEEMQGVPHHLIDVLDPGEPFDVVRFTALAQQAIEDIVSRGHLPVLVGGTGFYIQALRYGVDFSESDTDSAYRRSLTEEAQRIGAEALHEKLRQIDPEAAEAIHPNNVRRVIRAIEFFHMSGMRISEHNRRMRTQPDVYNSVCFVLTMDRQKLYERIDARVDKMMEEGLLSEVKRLYDAGYRRGLTSMQGLGYKEMLDVLDGSVSLEDAVLTLKRDTRHFAKRQLTWFGRERDVLWLSKDEHSEAELLEIILKELKRRSIAADDKGAL